MENNISFCCPFKWLFWMTEITVCQPKKKFYGAKCFSLNYSANGYYLCKME